MISNDSSNSSSSNSLDFELDDSWVVVTKQTPAASAVNESPISKKCIKILFEIGAELKSEIEGNDEGSSSLSGQALTCVKKQLPTSKTVGKQIGKYLGQPIATKMINTAWYTAFPKAEPTVFGNIVNAISWMGKGAVELAVGPKMSIPLTMASTFLGGIGTQLVVGAATKALTGGSTEKATLNELSNVSMLYQFDKESGVYFDSQNQPINEKDVSYLNKHMRQYQFIVDVLEAANRGEIETLISEGMEGIPTEGKALEKYKQRIVKLTDHLTRTYPNKKKIEEGLKEIGKYYKAEVITSPVHQAKMTEITENMDQIKVLLNMPADPSSMYFDEATCTLQPAGNFLSGWWYGTQSQSSDSLAENVSEKLKTTIISNLTGICNELLDITLSTGEANDLRSQLDEIEKLMVDFSEGIEKLPYEENKKLITSSRDLSDDMKTRIIHIRTQIGNQLESKDK